VRMGFAHGLDNLGFPDCFFPYLCGCDAGIERGCAVFWQLREPDLPAPWGEDRCSLALWLAIHHLADHRGSAVAQLSLWELWFFPKLHDRGVLWRILCRTEFLDLRTMWMGYPAAPLAPRSLARCDLGGVGASVLNSLGTKVFFGNDMPIAATWFFLVT